MKVIIEMTREEGRLAVSSGALLALLNEEEPVQSEKPCCSCPDTLAAVPEIGSAPVAKQVENTPGKVEPEPQPYLASPVAETVGQVNAQVTPIATTERTYSLDELATAAMGLMQQGMQPQLQELLQQFGVIALPELPKGQYGAFATALRGMGAQI